MKLTQSKDDRRKIYEFLKHHPIGTMATVGPDGDPHAAIIYFSVTEDLAVGFTTKRRTRKFDNLQRDGRAMLAVYEAASQTTVQITGIAEEVTDEHETQEAFRNMLETSLAWSDSGLPPLARLSAGAYVAMRLKPVEIRMSVFNQADPEGIGDYEKIEYIPG